jgi:hypothetical protein
MSREKGHAIQTIITFTVAAAVAFVTTAAISSGCRKDDAEAVKSQAPTAEKPKLEIHATMTPGDPKAAPAPASAAPVEPAKKPRMVNATGPVKATLEGQELTFASATARINFQGAEIILSTTPATCEDQEPDAAVKLTMDLSHGPGAKLYSGADLPMAMRFSTPSGKPRLDHDFISAEYGAVSLEEFTWGENGHIRGAVEFSYIDQNGKASKGTGAFDALTCGEYSAPKFPSPDAAKAGPVSGTVQGKPFAAKSAIAMLHTDEANGLTQIQLIELYPQEGVTCGASRSKAIDAGGFIAFNQDALTSRHAILGAKVPIGVSFEHANVSNGATWAQFDAAELKAGSKVTGKIAGANKDKEPKYDFDLSGSFEATVCE